MKVYLSHAEADSEVARRISDLLESLGHEVWDSERQVLPGGNWAREIDRALRSSQAMVVILSPRSVDSSWVRREVEWALSSRSYAGRLIPVYIGDVPDAPWILRTLSGIQLDDDIEAGVAEVARQLEARAS